MWVNGTALYYTTRLEDFRRFYFAPIAENIEILKFLTWSTLFVEFSLFTLIWLKDLRYIVIALGLLLHISIDLSMNLPTFQWLMMAAFIPFIYPEDLEKLADRIRRLCDRVLGPPTLAIYDGTVKAVAIKAELLARLDFLKRRTIICATVSGAQEIWNELLADPDSAKEIEKLVL